jgi:uncharacterized protein (DUF169 family)
MARNFALLSTSLQDALQLALPPVAVTLGQTAPAGVAPVTQTVAAGCVFWELGAQHTFATTSKDHALCAIGTFTHNMAGTPAHEEDRKDALKVFADLGYLPPSELATIPTLPRRVETVVYGPLAQAQQDPDVVLLFVKPSQTLLLAEAATSVDGGTPPAMGRPACAIVPQAVNSQRAVLSLGCCGARAYVNALTDDVALFALPGARLELYVERLTVLAKANATLSTFHTLRKRDVAAGKTPTIAQSVATLMAGG